MREYGVATIMASLLAVSLGCAMGSSEHDCTYSAYGGRWQRADLSHGRVGSLFDPADGQVVETGVLPEAQPDTLPPKGETGDGTGDKAPEEESVLAP